MKHLRTVTNTPALGQSPIQVKLDFSTDLTGVFATLLPTILTSISSTIVTLIQNMITFGGATTTGGTGGTGGLGGL
ncbi:MAG: hypothetical protein WC655_23235 [Candidatus Hydrogenedentales bacterium]